MKENDEEINTNINNNNKNHNKKNKIEEISNDLKLEFSNSNNLEESHSLLSNQLKPHRQKELSQDCFIGAEIASSELLSEIINVNLESTLNSILNPKKKFFKQLSIENIMSWQNSEIN